jgi:D-alanyl-D-alanine carboxypeptidase (penicillin-binding protein 5/6)
MRTGVVIVVLLLVAYVVVQLVRPLPAPTLGLTVPATERVGGNLRLAWPQQGQAAVAVAGTGMVGTYGPTTSPQPIASLAKMMTALVVLNHHPLGPGESGPSITFTAADAARYRQEAQAQQSVVKVVPGESLTEYQALEALLIPSANNVAHKLATWVAGSDAAFVRLMNQQARALGLRHTHYADASGVSPATVSTAPDQVAVALAAMANPVFRQIVAKPQVTLPVAGLTYNVNWDLGKNGIVGVKTGSTAEAGGCFVFAGYKTVGGQQALIVGDVLGQPGPSIITTALSAGSRLLSSARRVVRPVTWVHAGETVATLKTAWAPAVRLVATDSVTTWGWPTLRAHLTLAATLPHPGRPVARGTRVGTLVVRVGTRTFRVPVVTTASLPAPGLKWRLTHV